MSHLLADSIDFCQSLARRTGKNFYWSFLTLPRPMRRDMGVLYAFMRTTDDIGDDPWLPAEHRSGLLALWRQSLEAAASGACPTADELRERIGQAADLPSVDGCDKDHAGRVRHFSQILPAVGDLIRRRELPLSLFHDVIDGVASDLTPRRIETFADLERYCYQVAGAVGLCCIHIWGFHHEEAKQHAIDCGTAFQLTNILRDLREDARNGRVYLPHDELLRFGVSADDLRLGHVSSGLRDLVRFQTQRGWDYYRRAARIIPCLSRAGQRVNAAMLGIYSGLLAEIERREGDILSQRIELARRRKLTAAFNGWLRPHVVADRLLHGS